MLAAWLGKNIGKVLPIDIHNKGWCKEYYGHEDKLNSSKWVVPLHKQFLTLRSFQHLKS